MPINQDEADVTSVKNPGWLAIASPPSLRIVQLAFRI